MILWSYSKQNVEIKLVKTDNSTYEVIEYENNEPIRSILCSSYEEAHETAFRLINTYDTN